MSRFKELRTPIFWAEGLLAKLDRESWVLEVSGLCANPKEFTWQELIALSQSIADARLTSVTRFSGGLGLMLPGLTFKLPGAGLIVLAVGGMKLLSAKQRDVTINS